MPKVDKISIRFQGEWKQLEVHFSPKTNFYIKDCPGEVLEFGEFENRDKTLDGLKHRFSTAVSKTEDMLRQTRKVILVKFSISSELIATSKTGGNGYSIDTNHSLYRFCADFLNKFDGYGFSIDYRTAIEVTQGTEKLYFHEITKDYSYRRGALHVSKNETPIVYSEKAIESLENIKSSLKNMIINISVFFQNQDNLQVALETGNLKMLN